MVCEGKRNVQKSCECQLKIQGHHECTVGVKANMICIGLDKLRMSAQDTRTP